MTDEIIGCVADRGDDCSIVKVSEVIGKTVLIVIQEGDLPADRPYLFGYHPHGIIGMCVW